MVDEHWSHKTFASEGKNVHLYSSNRSGLSCVHVDLDTPTVSGHFTLVTECFDDTGSPHTLEHLVFLGSKLWPYKGILDSLANRAFAQGTNAWTDVDHTAYTIDTVGEEGFLRILPIFVDHILHPTLTESGCYTEVHHINGEGQDAGVVYSEMQGVENTGPNLMNLRTQRMIHDKNSSYRSETGGIMDDIRGLTVDQIRDYHASYYCPQNLVLIITGKVDAVNLLQTLESVDENILAQKPPKLDGYRRPFLATKPEFAQLTESKIETLKFPEQDESMGDVTVSWPGPSCTDHLETCALDLIGTYLTHSAVSPIQAELVEVEEPLCTDADFYVSDRLRSIITITLSSVPVEELETAEEKLLEVLRSVVEDEFDMERMQQLIHKERLKVKNAVETDPHGSFANPIITDFIYGSRDGESLQEALNDDKWLDAVALWTSEDWQAFVQSRLIDRPHLTILGRPSAEMAKKLEEAEKTRIAEQIGRYGPDGLERLAKRLKLAQDQNDEPIPDHIINDFPVSSIDHVRFIQPQTARFGETPHNLPKLSQGVAQSIIDADSLPTSLPVFYQVDTTAKSRFVTINVYIVPTAIDEDLLPYISVFLHSFFLNPLIRSGVLVDYEDVVEELENETVSYSASFGAGSGFNELVRIKIRAEATKYQTAIDWLRDLLIHPVFTGERLGVAISKIVNDLPSIKRDGDTVASSVLSVLMLKKGKSVARAGNVLEQTKFLEELEQQLEEDEEGVVRVFERLRHQLVRPENMYIHIAADVEALEKPTSSWTSFCADLPPRSGQMLMPIPSSSECLSTYGQNARGRATLITIPVESCYAQHFSAGIKEWDHPDLPALLVMTSYLNAMEGLLWKFIRGSGLAYGADLKIDLGMGVVFFSIYRAPDAYAAWAKARDIMGQLVSGEVAINAAMVEGAKSALVYDYISREATPAAAAHASFVSQILKQQGKEYVHELLSKVQQVTLEDMKSAMAKYLVQLFNHQTSNVVCVCGPTKVDSLEKSFKDASFDVAASSLEEFEKAFI